MTEDLAKKSRNLSVEKFQWNNTSFKLSSIIEGDTEKVSLFIQLLKSINIQKVSFNSQNVFLNNSEWLH